MRDMNLTPQSIRNPHLRHFFTNIHPLQFITIPKLAISGELPTTYLLEPPTIRKGRVQTLLNSYFTVISIFDFLSTISTNIN